VDYVQAGYYDGTIFHRVIPNFMIQGGDPLGEGYGGESAWGGRFDDEIDRDSDLYSGVYEKGTVAMANAGPNTNGSQFFIMHGDWSNRLPKNYSIFGKVFAGMDVVNKIASAETSMGQDGASSKPIKPVKIVSIKIERVGGASKAPAKRPARKTASG